MEDREEYVRRWNTSAQFALAIAVRVLIGSWLLIGFVVYSQPQGRMGYLAGYVCGSAALATVAAFGAWGYALSKVHNTRRWPMLWREDYREPWLR